MRNFTNMFNLKNKKITSQTNLKLRSKIYKGMAMLMTAITMFGVAAMPVQAKSKKDVADEDRIMGCMANVGMDVKFTWIYNDISNTYPAFAVALSDGTVLVVSDYVDTFSDYTWATGSYTYSVSSCHYYAPGNDYGFFLYPQGNVSGSNLAYYTMSDDDLSTAYSLDSLCVPGTPTEGEEVIIQYYTKSGDVKQEKTKITGMDDDGMLLLKDIPKGIVPMAILDADDPKVAYGYVGVESGKTKKIARSFTGNTETFYYKDKEILNDEVIFGNMEYTEKDGITKTTSKGKNKTVDTTNASDRMGRILGFDSIGNNIYHASAVAFETASGQIFIISGYGDNNAFRNFDFYYETTERTRIPLEFYGYYTDDKFSVWGLQKNSDEKDIRDSKSFTVATQAFENEYTKAVMMYDEGNNERYVDNTPAQLNGLNSDGTMDVSFGLDGSLSVDGMFFFVDAEDNGKLLAISIADGKTHSLSTDIERFGETTEDRDSAVVFEAVKSSEKTASNVSGSTYAYFGAVEVYDADGNDVATSVAFAYTDNNKTVIISNDACLSAAQLEGYSTYFIPLSEDAAYVDVTFEKNMHLCNSDKWMLKFDSDSTKIAENGTLYTKTNPYPNEEVKVVYIESGTGEPKEYITKTKIKDSSALSLEEVPDNALFPYLILDAADDTQLVGYAYSENGIILDYDKNYIQKMEADQGRVFSDAELYVEGGDKKKKEDNFVRVGSVNSSLEFGRQTGANVLVTNSGRYVLTADFSGDWFHWYKVVYLEKENPQTYTVEEGKVSEDATLKIWTLDNGEDDEKKKANLSAIDKYEYTAKPAYYGETVKIIYLTDEEEPQTKSIDNVKLGLCSPEGIITLSDENLEIAKLGNAIMVDSENTGYMVGYIDEKGVAHNMYNNLEIYYDYDSIKGDISNKIIDDKSLLANNVDEENEQIQKSSGKAGKVVLTIILLLIAVGGVVFVLNKKGII